MLLKLEKFFDTFADIVGYITAIATFLMMLNVFTDVILRYFFKTGSIAMQELEWHFFAVVMLLGITYSLKRDAHVRVDIFYDKYSTKKKALTNIIGTVLFLFPITLLIATDSISYAIEAFESGESSGDPGGLPYRWIVKSLIPLSFWILAFYGIGFIVKNINLYKGANEPKDEKVLKS